jgi:DNA-binding response OmpR family regulator
MASATATDGTAKGRILVVDDAEPVREMLSAALARSGYAPVAVGDAPQALRALYDERPHLMLTDLTLPGMTGFELIGRVRELTDIPLIVLSGNGDEAAKVRALSLGADDYVVKPAPPAELVARVSANLRRAGGGHEVPAVYQDAALCVDLARHQVLVEGRPVSLTPQEFRLMSALVRQPGVVRSADELLDACWGSADGGPEGLRVYIGYLRRKLGDDARLPRLIETVRGFGYRYAPPGG